MQKTTRRCVRGGWCVALVGLFLFSSIPLAAQSVVGAIEGRVQNGARSEYLENVLVTIEGTGLQTRTDQAGQYRFSNVPVGTVQVRVVYTGYPVQTQSVVVSAGQFAQRDFDLSAAPSAAPTSPGSRSDPTIKLDAFVVATSKEMDAAAFALNEKRVAPNIVNVIAGDEFGDNPDGNIGEFLKFLPGVQVDYNGGEPRSMQLSGTGSGFLPITTGGFNLASAASGFTGRNVELEQLSMNNVSRVEVIFSQTPESPGGAIGGSVNLVPRSAFERSRPSLNASVFYMFRDNDRHFRDSPGPQSHSTPKVNPGAEFNYSSGALTKWFGFTLSGATSMQYAPQDVSLLTWQGAGSATNGTTFPNTTPDKPYLTSYGVRDAVKNTERDSLGATLDFKLGRYDTISVGFSWALFDAQFNDRSTTWNVGSVAVGNFDAFHTYGNTGAGSFTFGGSQRQKQGTTWTPTLRWRHNGPIWKMDVGLSHSHASNHYRDIDQGYFNAINLRRTGLTVRFDDNWYLRPGKITVTDGTTGATVDTTRVDSTFLNTANSDTKESSDVKQSFQASISRSFLMFGERRIPLNLKVGTVVDRMLRDIRLSTTNFTWVGPDKVAHNGNPNTATSTDDNAGQITDPEFYRSLPFGFPMQHWPSHALFWNLYKTHPEYFTTDMGGNAEYLSRINGSKFTDEIDSAAYFRFDVAFFNNRLKMTGGYRAEQTNIHGEGPSNDPTANYQRDSSGKVIRNAAGVIQLKVPTTDALGVSKLTRLDRGTIAEKESLKFFPSINADLTVIENLQLKMGVSQTTGRPDLNQYMGGVTLPDTETNPPPGNPSVAAGRITVNNVGLKPQDTNSINLALDYYFPRSLGSVSISGFRRFIRNFNNTIQYYPDKDFYTLYGLDEAIYGSYPVSTQVNNQNKVRIEGFDFSYRQGLDRVLPQWARGVSVFANMSTQRQTGLLASTFNNNRPRQYKWGFTLARPKFKVIAGWAYQAKRQRNLVTGTSIPADTYNWDSKKLNIDVQGEYWFTRNLGAYVAMRNLNDATDDQQRYSEKLTPLHARFLQRNDYGSLWTMGLKYNR